MIFHSKDWWLKTNQCSPKNPLVVATEIFKYKTGMSPELMNDTFPFIEKPTIWENYALERNQDYTVYHGSGSLPFVFNHLPDSIKKICVIQGIQNKN